MFQSSNKGTSDKGLCSIVFLLEDSTPAPVELSLMGVFPLFLSGFLISLLTQLTHFYSHSLRHDADTQTTSGASHGESLGMMAPSTKHSFQRKCLNGFLFFCLPRTVEKMKVIDQEYERFNYSGDKWFSFQSKLDAYRREIDAQMQEEMNTKVCAFYSNVNESKTV